MVSVRHAVNATLRAARDAALARESRARFAASAGALVLSVSMSWAPHAYAANADAAQAAATSNPPAPAAAASDDTLQEITVTGSRLKRADYEATSPLVTIDSSDLESKAGLNIESYLNQLPNYNPAMTPVTEAQDVQPTAIDTVGISTISLRGLGADRGLVLIDGHRATPVNALGVTDINTIPAAMIDRIESISGGASAVYGADAMSGVTNFILKKSFQGLQVDAQDGITQAGDGNELRVNVLMGTKFADGKGNIIMGGEYYDRRPVYASNRDFFTDAWTDPMATGAIGGGFFLNGTNQYATTNAPPSIAALNGVFPARAAANPGSFTAGQLPWYSTGTGVSYYFNNNASMANLTGAIGTSGYLGQTASNGYGLTTAYNPATLAIPGFTGPADEVQTLKWSNPTTLLALPQTRYSFYANGNFDITDKVKAFANVRFAQSDTETALSVPTSAVTGWEADIPFNAATDSPILPTAINNATSATQIQSILASVLNANGSLNTSSPYYNTGYVGPLNPSSKVTSPGTSGGNAINQSNASLNAQHPVPPALAALLLSRGAANGIPSVLGTGPGQGTGLAFGGPVNTCSNMVNITYTATGQPATACDPAAATSWSMGYIPSTVAAPQRTTWDTDTSWQIETGLDFPLHIADWTGELYYSRGQSTAYQQAFGNDSLDRFREVVESPGYGSGLSYQGNALNVQSPGFGTSVISTCGGAGFYNAIFNNAAAGEGCQNAVGSTLQTMTMVQQDVVEANFQGSLFKLPAGTVTAAMGYQFRRDSAQFQPDTLQSTSSFMDQTVGVYPTAALNAQVTDKDGYIELGIPVVKDLPFLKSLDLDLGGRYSSYSTGRDSTTFKINLDARITNAIRLRGGFNRADRAPNLGELYLNQQEFFSAGPAYGDPCSVTSLSPFGAGGAAAPVDAGSAASPNNHGVTANSNGAAGARSTYLICQAMMGQAGAAQYYGPNGNQNANAGAAFFGWLNQEGNPNLNNEQADTWTGGIVLSHLADNPWLGGLTTSVDYWNIRINNVIAMEDADYANYACFGAVQVDSAAAAATQAASQACQNVSRSSISGGALTEGLTYSNLGTIDMSGVDFNVNWIAQFADLGLSRVPGSLMVNTQGTWLDYYKTKTTPLSYDVWTDWRGSLGPVGLGLDAGAYSYRLFNTFSWVLPSLTVGVTWQFLPSVNPASTATQNAIIQNNTKALAAGHSNLILPWTPSTTDAYSHYNNIGLNFNWTVNKVLSVRGGINNLFDTTPPLSASRGYPTAASVTAACSAAQTKIGCAAPAAYSLPTDGAGAAPAFYDVMGRTFFLGVKAQF